MTNKSTNISQNSGSISLLAETIQCNNEAAIRLLIQRAVGAIYTQSSSWKQPALSDEDYNAVISLIHGMSPKDTVESVLAAQFITLHLQATANIARENYNIMGHNLQMIRLRHQALEMLQRYRGKSQTINVNYNVVNQRANTVDTIIQANQETSQKEE